MSEFTDSIDRLCEGFTVTPGCLGPVCEYADGDPEHQCEPFFSWSPCDSCGSTFGGDRETAHAISNERNEKGEFDIIEMSICVDCVVFWANGDLPEQWHASPDAYRQAAAI